MRPSASPTVSLVVEVVLLLRGAGVTVDAFDSAAQTAFVGVIADLLDVDVQHITVTSVTALVARRRLDDGAAGAGAGGGVEVAFEVDMAHAPATVAATLTSRIEAAAWLLETLAEAAEGGGESALVAALAAEGIAVEGVSVAVPLAPTGAPSAPPPAKEEEGDDEEAAVEGTGAIALVGGIGGTAVFLVVCFTLRGRWKDLCGKKSTPPPTQRRTKRAAEPGRRRRTAKSVKSGDDVLKGLAGPGSGPAAPKNGSKKRSRSKKKLKNARSKIEGEHAFEDAAGPTIGGKSKPRNRKSSKSRQKPKLKRKKTARRRHSLKSLMDNEDEIKEMSRVRVVNLAARPELDGRKGVAHAFDPKTFSWDVLLDGDEAVTMIPAPNLAKVVRRSSKKKRSRKRSSRKMGDVADRASARNKSSKRKRRKSKQGKKGDRSDGERRSEKRSKRKRERRSSKRKKKPELKRRPTMMQQALRRGDMNPDDATTALKIVQADRAGNVEKPKRWFKVGPKKKTLKEDDLVWPPPLDRELGVSEEQWEEFSLRATEDEEELVMCMITKQMMREPALVTTTGATYEREAITRWIEENGSDPINTKTKLTLAHLTPNLGIRKAVAQFVKRKLKE